MFVILAIYVFVQREHTEVNVVWYIHLSSFLVPFEGVDLSLCLFNQVFVKSYVNVFSADLDNCGNIFMRNSFAVCVCICVWCTCMYTHIHTYTYTTSHEELEPVEMPLAAMAIVLTHPHKTHKHVHIHTCTLQNPNLKVPIGCQGDECHSPFVAGVLDSGTSCLVLPDAPGNPFFGRVSHAV
jgi:hypothetical protein